MFSLRFHTTQYDLNDIYDAGDILSTMGFHTTQYDLNGAGILAKNPLLTGFHTTQYDLNLSCIFFSSFAKKVSILHSTI